MSSQVYYRKWRPRTFNELVGQEHIAHSLRQAVITKRIGHAYIFSGPRGTGKTTTARILSKVINCVEPNDGEPCNTCTVCSAVNENRFIDLIELDAASNRGIDEIRSIREKANFLPAEGSHKTYILDEAHMLTTDASNAFLKTLEEPPEHAVFILCTTDPQKLLQTILSRCQRFDFKRLSVEKIVERLEMISSHEKLSIGKTPLQTIARSAGGSLRDAENLLEQLVISYGTSVGEKEVNELFGFTDARHRIALEIVRYVLEGDVTNSISSINQGVWEGVELRELQDYLTDLLRGVLLIKSGNPDTIELSEDVKKDLQPLASKISISHIVNTLKLFGEVNFKYSSSSLPLELAVIDACIAHDSPAKEVSPAATPMKSRKTIPNKTPIPVKKEPELSDAPIPSMDTNKHKTASDMPDNVQNVTPSVDKTEDPSQTNLPQDQWEALIKNLSKVTGARFNIGALLRSCKSHHIVNNELTFKFAHRSHLERMQQELDAPKCRQTVEKHVADTTGTTYTVLLEFEETNTPNKNVSVIQSPLVKTALEMGARMIKDDKNPTK